MQKQSEILLAYLLIYRVKSAVGQMTTTARRESREKRK